MWESENQKIIAGVYTREEEKSNITLLGYFFISSLLIYFEILSQVKEKADSLLRLKIIFYS